MPAKLNDKLEKSLQYAERLRKVLLDLPELCFDYLISLETTTSILTRLNYAGDLRTFFEYMYNSGIVQRKPSECTINDIKQIHTRDIEMFLEYLSAYRDNDSQRILKNNNLGKKRKISAVRSFYKYLMRREYIKEDPASIISTPKVPQKPITYLSSDETERLLVTVENQSGLTQRQSQYAKMTQTRDIALITLFLGTGIRLSECVGIDIEDIDLSTNSFRVKRKGGKIAILYFSDEVKAPLEAYIAQRMDIKTVEGHEKALFLSLRRRRITERAVENLVKKYTSVSVPLKHITPHKFRSTFGTQLYQNTGDIYLVADVLGHEDVNTTKKHYAQMSEDNRKYAANAVSIRTDSKKKK